MDQLRSDFFRILTERAIICKRYYDPETGRFMNYEVYNAKGIRRQPDGMLGWGVVQQDVIIAFAYLYRTQGENNPFYQDRETLSMIVKAVAAWQEIMYEDYRMEFLKCNGDMFGPIYMPWSWYAWLETYILLHDDLSADVCATWEKILFAGFESYAKQDPTYIHNIPVWQAMCLHRAGQFFDKPDWIEAGDSLIANACTAQQDDGYWHEGKGPSVGYNMVYMHALGMYYAHGGAVDVLPAIKRGTAFIQACTYPNGAYVDTVDGRRRYHGIELGWLSPLSNACGFPALLATKGGIAHIKAHLSHFSKANATLAHLAAILIALDSGKFDSVDPFNGLENTLLQDCTVVYGSMTFLRKKNCQLTLSAYTGPRVESDFHLDRQAFASVWTEDADLLMGGINSRNQPELSSFVITDATGNILCDMPTDGTVTGNGSVSFDYAGFGRCSIAGTVADDGTISLRYTAALADPTHRWHISLPLRPNFEPTQTRYQVYSNQGKTTVCFRGWEVSFADDYRMMSPVCPHNPYTHDLHCEMDDCILAVQLFPGQDSITVTFTRENV